MFLYWKFRTYTGYIYHKYSSTRETVEINFFIVAKMKRGNIVLMTEDAHAMSWINHDFWYWFIAGHQKFEIAFILSISILTWRILGTQTVDARLTWFSTTEIHIVRVSIVCGSQIRPSNIQICVGNSPYCGKIESIVSEPKTYQTSSLSVSSRRKLPIFLGEVLVVF